MALFQFLAEIMHRFGIAISVDGWYYAAVGAIGFLPREQIETILRAYGHVVIESVCGITAMTDDGRFNRGVSQIWIAEPSPVCPVNQLRFFVEHELRHALVWIRDGLQVWDGHH